MAERIKISDLEYAVTDKPTDAALKVIERSAGVNQIFRELAIYDTHSIDDTMAEMLAAKIRQVRVAHPDLDEVEIYAIAGRLLKQLISCYQSALQQLLP